MTATCGDAARAWTLLPAEFDSGPGTRGSLGLIALATDRAGVRDFEGFLDSVPGVDVFATRIPISTRVTPDALRTLHGHLGAAAALLVPGSRLDAIAFSCTSGAVAVGLDRVAEAVGASRPGIPVTTPVGAAMVALRSLGAQRLSLLVPYLPETADLVAGFFEDAGFRVDRRTTFGLNGDPEMNRLSQHAIMAAASAHTAPESDVVFISCTGLRTAGLVAELEAVLGKPVLTSNQVLAWHALRLAGITDKVHGKGRLFIDA